MTDTRRWDVQIDVQDDHDIRGHVNKAVAILMAELHNHGIRATVTAFDADGDGYNSWDHPTDTTLDPELRGYMESGYTSEKVNEVFNRIRKQTGINLVCVWDYVDYFGAGGSSNFYVDLGTGTLHELAGDMWRWLNIAPDDPDCPQDPGQPATWIGGPTTIRLDELAWYDNFHNHATYDHR